jgi:hypothetical protein
MIGLVLQSYLLSPYLLESLGCIIRFKICSRCFHSTCMHHCMIGRASTCPTAVSFSTHSVASQSFVRLLGRSASTTCDFGTRASPYFSASAS